MNTPNLPTPKVVTVVRLHADIYAQLEKKLSRTVVTEASTPLSVAYAMGVEAALKEIRNGLVQQAES